MHAILVTPAYLPLPGGGERYVATLARGLTARGWQVTVVTSTATLEADFWEGTSARVRSEAVEDGVSVLRCPVRSFPGGRRGLMLWRKAMVLLSAAPGNQTAALSRMARWVPRIVDIDEALESVEGATLIHAFNLSWEHGLVAAERYADRSRIPLFVTPFAHLGTGHRDRVALNSTMDHQLGILRKADRVLVLTSVERSDLTEYGISPERIGVIGGGIDPLPAVKPAAILRIDLPPVYGIFIGRLSFDKGVIHAADAVRALRRSGREVTLLLAGSTTPEFDRYYARLSPSEKQFIRPIGTIVDDEKYHLLAGARFLMLPSRCDSFGIVLLEAWAHGVPVIAARAGGIPGVVDDDQNGVLVPFGDVAGLTTAMGRLLDDPVLARRLGENGRAKVATQYQWETVTDKVLSHYTAVLTGQ